MDSAPCYFFGRCILARIYFFCQLLIDIIVVMRMVILEVFFLARNEAVMGGKIFEEAVVVGALPIFEAL